MFCDRCAPDLINTGSPLLGCIIKRAFQVVQSDRSSIYQPTSSYFCAIVAVEEVGGASRTFVNIAFREVGESEAHVNRPGVKSYAVGRCAEVGCMVAHHLGGLQVVEDDMVGWVGLSVPFFRLISVLPSIAELRSFIKSFF